MTTQYFIPKLEDFREGYECEINSYAIKSNWYKVIVQHRIPDRKAEGFQSIIPDMIHYHFLQGRVRVQYLDPDLLKDDGWAHKWFDGEADTWTKGKLILTAWSGNNSIEGQSRILIDYGKRRLFDGTCKDINTLRQILKLTEV
jgi:hypothetical protein